MLTEWQQLDIRHCHLQTAKPPNLGTVTPEQALRSAPSCWGQGPGGRTQHLAVVPARNPCLSQERLAPALAHPGCLRAGTSGMMFSVHGASQESHLHLLVKAQLGFHSLPQGTCRVTEAAADRHLHSRCIFQDIPHTCSTPEAFYAGLEQRFPCSMPPVFTITAEKETEAGTGNGVTMLERKENTQMSKQGQLIIRMEQQVHF